MSLVAAPRAELLSRRRCLSRLLGALAVLVAGASGCGSAPALVAAPQPEPTDVPELSALLPGAGLRWLLRLRPQAIAASTVFAPLASRFLPRDRLSAYRELTGLDLGQLPELYLAGYAIGDTEEQLALLRHPFEPALLERRFTARAAASSLRSADRVDLVRVSGTVGGQAAGFARLGADVAAYQRGGSLDRGALRVACLRAQGKLLRQPGALELDELRQLAPRFGDAPVRLFLRGPFDGELKGAALGLLEVATAVGVALRPTARGQLGVAVTILAEWGDRGAEAAELLGEAYASLGRSSFGRILGLHDPVEPPIVAGDRGVANLSVELDASRFAQGLAALVEHDLERLLELR